MQPVDPSPLALPGGPAAAWALWVVVVAVVVLALAEWPKRRWIKPSKSWQSARTRRDKLMLLTPLLAAFGVVVGGPVFHAADLVERWGLAFALGAAVGGLSWAIYDGAVATIALVPRIVKKKAGIGDTSTMNALPVEGTEPAEVDGTSTAGADGETKPPAGAA